MITQELKRDLYAALETNLEQGKFGFVDSAGASRTGTKKLTAELTIRAGKIMWDLNGRAATGWKSFKYPKRPARP